MSAPSQYQHSLEFDFRTGRPWRRSLIRAFKRWIAWKVEQRRVRREIRDLLEKDDWLLHDVGLTRHEVRAAMRSSKPRKARL
jgi:uncharacterized protein YjiS (DUF1127 family)